MDNHNPNSTASLTHIALSVAALIAGGGCIFFFSRWIPFPGMKYLLMSPYLSLVMTIVMRRIPASNLLLKINTVFGLIMSLVTLYMGLAIFMTGLLSQLVYNLLPGHSVKKIRFSAASYSAFTVLTALLISKFMIGGPIFEAIHPLWMLSATLIGFGLGILGTFPGMQVAARVRS